MTPPALAAYRFVTSMAKPIIYIWLLTRARRAKEDPGRLSERWGRTTRSRPPGILLWLHGASVGESLALLSLIERARATRPDVTILTTSGTRAAAEVMARRLPDGAIHQYAPIDSPQTTSAFVEHWRPDLGVFVESEIWPNLLTAAKRRGVRLALLSARLSPASLRRWRRAPASARAVFGAFDLVLARDDEQAAKLAVLGVEVEGRLDLKFGAAPLPRDTDVIAEFFSRTRGPVLLAASTHPGEDRLILSAFHRAYGPGSEAVLIIAPRHPQRGETIARLAEGMGFAVARRRVDPVGGASDVLVADTIGELGTWFTVANLALIGGGWRRGVGGHNPIEPARLGCPVFSGPAVGGWPIYAEMAAVGAARIVAPEDLQSVMTLPRDDPAFLKRMTTTATAYVQARDQRIAATLDRVLTLLP